MQTGDIVTPMVSRFPEVDRKGLPTGLEDEELGEPARITKIYRCFVEVEFVESRSTCVYRKDEVTFVCTREHWARSID